MGRMRLAQPRLLRSGILAIALGAGSVAASEEPRRLPPDPDARPESITGPLRTVSHTADESGQMRATLDRINVLSPGTSDRESLRAAQAALPLDRLSPASRRRAMGVLGNLSMFRQMPTVRMEVDHDVYRYFIEHPDVAVSIWRAMDVSKCELWQTGPHSYETDVGDGSAGAIDVLHRSEREQLVYGEGRFKSPLLIRPIEAHALLHLRTDYLTGHDGKTETVCRGTLFVSFPSQTIETAAKVISPVTNMVIDRNFEEIGLFVHMMTLAMRNQPGWVENLTGQLDGILERRKPELLEVTAKAYVAHRRRQMDRWDGPVSVQDAGQARPLRANPPRSR